MLDPLHNTAKSIQANNHSIPYIHITHLHPHLAPGAPRRGGRVVALLAALVFILFIAILLVGALRRRLALAALARSLKIQSSGVRVVWKHLSNHAQTIPQ